MNVLHYRIKSLKMKLIKDRSNVTQAMHYRRGVDSIHDIFR